MIDSDAVIQARIVAAAARMEAVEDSLEQVENTITTLRAQREALLQAAALGAAMLSIEARSWRERGEPQKAEPIEGAIARINATIEEARS